MRDHSIASGRPETKSYESLRAKLDDVGSVFEFVIVDLDHDVSVDETAHRRILSELYEQIMKGQRDWHRKRTEDLPVSNYPVPTMVWNLHEAVGHALTPRQAKSLGQVEEGVIDSRTLYADFCNSLSSSEPFCDFVGMRLLFHEWIDALGLTDDCGVIVYSWINTLGKISLDCSASSGRTTWTEFFCRGSMSQHGWCLTVWNPVRRTLAALAACTTLRSRLFI